MKPVAGRMPSFLQSIFIQNGAKGDIRIYQGTYSTPKAILVVTAPALAKPWHSSAISLAFSSNAVGPKKFASIKFTG